MKNCNRFKRPRENPESPSPSKGRLFQVTYETTCTEKTHTHRDVISQDELEQMRRDHRYFIINEVAL